MKPPVIDPFGVLAFLHWNHDWNNFHFNKDVLHKALDQFAEINLSFVRMDILWSDIHRGRLQYDFSKYDHLVDEVTQRGINILGVLQYNKEDRKDGQEIWNRPPDSYEEFAAYVSATVSRYQDRIAHWEIWNEPNLSIYWSEPKNGLKDYCRLLELSYKAAKQADPSCIVLNGGLTDPILEDVGNLYRHGGKTFSDIINIHTFFDPNNRESPAKFDAVIAEVEKIMDEHGDHEKKIWITEMGCPGVPQDRKHLKWFAGEALDEQQQAQWLEKQYQMASGHPRIEKLFWAFYRDTDNEFRDATDFLGIVRLDLSPKPAFESLKNLIARHNSNVGNGQRR